MARSIEALDRERRMNWGTRIFQLADEGRLEVIMATAMLYHVCNDGKEAVLFMDTGLVVFKGRPAGWGLRDLKKAIGVKR